MDKQAKIFVAGHRGMVGSAIVRKLQAEGYNNLILKTSKELDLRNQLAVEDFFKQEQPEYVFLAAAKVGGIIANSSYPAEFIYDNLLIQTNVIHQSWQNNVKRLLFLGIGVIGVFRQIALRDRFFQFQRQFRAFGILKFVQFAT